MLEILKYLIIFPLLAYSAKLSGNDIADCPESYEKHIVIIMSLDGFRPDYLNRGLTPTMQSLIDEGVSTPYMISSYPTVTFPNHYSIVTGLYPESHGIIANTFNDTIFNEEFSSSNGAATEGKWFGGDPIWNTVIRNGMKSATYFWFGSEAEINGMRPNYYYAYSNNDPFEGRIEKVLEWLALPIEDRPTWISVYFHEPDSVGHEYGPTSPELDAQLEIMDGLVLQLVDGINSLGLASCVNLIITSDHGMAQGGEDQIVNLDDYEPSLDEKSDFYLGANTRIRMKAGYEAEPVMESLACENVNMRQFDQKSLPKRYHFSNNPNRIEDIILDLNSGYTTNFEENYYRQGNHGYDNKYLEVQSLFIAYGPDLIPRTVIEPFQNIELYNLMCDLLEIEPTSNNGTKGALYHIMASPPVYPSLPLGESPESAIFPGDVDLLNRLGTSGCSGDLSSPEDWVYSLDIGEAEQEALNVLHIPFGAPIYDSSLSANVTLLYHSDHITGFSQTLKMPVWTSFTLSSTRSGTSESLWSSDVRLSAIDSPTCSDYELLTNYSMKPLFVPAHSQDEDLDRLPFMISNALPMTAELDERYSELMTELVPIWQELHEGPINIIAGPIFDSDFNSLVDDFPQNGEATSVIVPSDIFVIVMKCNSAVIEDFRNCAISDMQISGFIYTQTQTVKNCLGRESFAKEFSGRVKDISLATGLIFNTDLSYQDSIDLTLRFELDIWPTVSSRQPSSGISPVAPSRHYLSYLVIISIVTCILY